MVADAGKDARAYVADDVDVVVYRLLHAELYVIRAEKERLPAEKRHVSLCGDKLPVRATTRWCPAEIPWGPVGLLSHAREEKPRRRAEPSAGIGRGVSRLLMVMPN